MKVWNKYPNAFLIIFPTLIVAFIDSWVKIDKFLDLSSSATIGYDLGNVAGSFITQIVAGLLLSFIVFLFFYFSKNNKAFLWAWSRSMLFINLLFLLMAWHIHDNPNF